MTLDQYLESKARGWFYFKDDFTNREYRWDREQNQMKICAKCLKPASFEHKQLKFSACSIKCLQDLTAKYYALLEQENHFPDTPVVPRQRPTTFRGKSID